MEESSSSLKYDVFFNCTGDHTSNSFIGHLQAALKEKKIETFTDYERSSSLLKAIEECRVSIVIFSKDYASSAWSLEELVKILECKNMYGQIVIPVFYGIATSDVRTQTGSFGDAFTNHQQVFGENSKKLQRWRAALAEAANLSVSHSSANKPEWVLIKEIVQDVLKWINNMSSSGDDDLVGMDSKIEQTESSLHIGTEDVDSVKLSKIEQIELPSHVGTEDVQSVTLKVPSSSSSISISTPQFKYDVFLSFRGEDTRNNIISHLHAALWRKDIKIFIDYQLRKGHEISPSLLTAIQESRISIVFFSKNYASSTWCLEELVKILECREMHGQIVIPVFHGISPSDVRKQTGNFRDAFAKHEKVFGENSEKLQRWRSALTKAANLSGWDSNFIRVECVLVNKIVNDVLRKLEYFSSIAKLVGVESKINSIESLLCGCSNDVRAIGICGIGGMGKTTLARAVFQKISFEFEGSCYIPNVRERSERSDGLSSGFRQEVFSKLLGDNIFDMKNNYVGDSYIRSRLGRKKLLIVIDDVTNFQQIEFLIDGGYLGSQSRVIITSRDKEVLKNCRVDVDHIYEVNALSNNEALKLFSQHAFEQNHPKLDYMELSNEVVTYAGGVPLALKVLGHALFCKSKQEWIPIVHKLRRMDTQMNQDVHNVLKISYDCLSAEEQNIFIDIACFFVGWDIVNVKRIIDSNGFCADRGLSSLIDKSLVTLSSNTIEMHDLIQVMGRKIVRQESIKECGKRSRLWHPEDIYHVMRSNTGTESILGISLDMSKIRDLHINPSTFTNMSKLRFLNFYSSRKGLNSKVCPIQGLESSFTKLQYFHWHAYPLNTLPSNFHPENLVVLDLPYSNITQLWNVDQHLESLKCIDLSHTKLITHLPDLSLAPALESLILEGCISFLEIPSSIQFLNKLVRLNLRDCKSLKSLPNCIHLQSLRILILSGCSNLNMLPEMPGNIQELYLGGTLIEELPSTFEYLSCLVILDLENCSRLNSLPNNMGKLKCLEDLNLTGCSKLDRLPDELGNLEALKKLNVSRTGLREVPSSIACLINLGMLSFERCQGEEPMGLLLPPLKGLCSLTNLVLSDCNIKELPDSLGCLSPLKMLFLCRNHFESIPASIINLSKLILLDISNCRRLQSLPILPRDLKLVAHNCTSLEAFSGVSVLFRRPSYTLEIDFINCFKLDQIALRNLVDYAMLKIQLIPIAFSPNFDEESDEMPIVLISYPGSEIPEWFTFQNEEPFVSIRHLPPGWFSENLVCFVLCAVVAFRDHHDDGRGLVLVCECEFKSQEGYCHLAKGSLFCWSDDSSGTHYVGLDHVFMGCDFAMYPENFGENYYTNEFSAQFYLEDYHSKRMACCEVKKCGLRLIHQHEYGKPLLSISADEDYFCKNLEETIGSYFGDMEEEEPYPKSCKLSKELLMQKSTTGLLETFGGGDVRIQALRTPEHCGLVDGLGKFFPSAHQFKDITTERRLADSESTVQAHAEQLHEEKTKDQCCQLELDSKENVVAPYDESLIKVKDEVDTSQKVTNFQHVQKKQKLHPIVAMFSKLVDRCVDNSTLIELNNEEEPFGTQCSTLITAEDCHIMISMTQLTVSCINAYIRILYGQLEENGRLGQFAFINPASVSLAGGPDNSLRSNERAQEVASCLQKATGTRFVFMPYNPGFHWILVLIDMSSMTIYYLDSLRGFVNSDLKNIVETGLRIYRSQVNEEWKCVQVPMQPGNVECGYYVLRFMKDIITDISLLTENFHGKNTYTQEEIEEVRCEWITFVSQYI